MIFGKNFEFIKCEETTECETTEEPTTTTTEEPTTTTTEETTTDCPTTTTEAHPYTHGASANGHFNGLVNGTGGNIDLLIYNRDVWEIQWALLGKKQFRSSSGAAQFKSCLDSNLL